jgi:hypothetical protein
MGNVVEDIPSGGSKQEDIPKTARYKIAAAKRKKRPANDYDLSPSLYRPRYVRAAALLASNGATDSSLAEFFGISLSTLGQWKMRHKAFGDAVNGATQALTPVVERNLALRAIGWQQDAEKLFYDSSRGEVVRATTREHYPPDTRAAERWLQAKGGPEWQPAAQRIDHRVLVRNMSDDELAQALSDAQALLAPSEGGGE